MHLPDIIEKNFEELQAICKRHHVKKIELFGSVMSNNFNSKSDIDFLVDFEEMDPGTYFDNYFELVDSLEKLFGRHVDILSEKSLTNPYFIKNISKSRTPIYV
ncbi:MAG: nucleotidyltransferase domain-containing protein [Fulvivirga sp.]|uniref:nucleotidyltransferase family protein n=1 Tax=Fulvivirga sp. TaxID=1931237 RepID=UPI0032ED6D31